MFSHRILQNQPWTGLHSVCVHSSLGEGLPYSELGNSHGLPEVAGGDWKQGPLLPSRSAKCFTDTSLVPAAAIVWTGPVWESVFQRVKAGGTK